MPPRPMGRRAFLAAAGTVAGAAAVLTEPVSAEPAPAAGAAGEVKRSTLPPGTAAADVRAGIAAAVAAGRVGTPVYVRLTQRTDEPANALTAALAQSAARVRAWIGQPVQSVYAVAAGDSSVSVALAFAGGATALVTVLRADPRGSGLDALIVGTRGSITHDGDVLGWDEPLIDAGAADAGLLAAIDASIKSGKPAEVRS